MYARTYTFWRERAPTVSTDLDVLVVLSFRRGILILASLPRGLKHDRHGRKSGEDGLEQV